MRGTKAKQLRRMVYGTDAIPRAEHRRYVRMGQADKLSWVAVCQDRRRQQYQELKRRGRL